MKTVAKTQKVAIVLIISLFFFYPSCDKKNKPANMTLTVPTAPSVVQSVRAWWNITSGICHSDIPIPTDSSAFTELDLDVDGKMDFRVTTSHQSVSNPSTCGSHCLCVDYSIVIESLVPGASIACPKKSNKAKMLDKGMEIEKSLDSREAAFISTQKEYVGVRLKHSYYGWIRINGQPNNGFRINAYAISGTRNKLIKAGEGG